MTFSTKTIKSNYLQDEYSVSCWETEQNGRKLTIIEHAAFEDIIFNKLHAEGFVYDIDAVVGFQYPTAKCTMTDSNGRKIIAFGEAHPSSLINQISRQNPFIMAANRAFDRAAIRYLDLEGKVYSSDEIPSNDNESGCEEEQPDLSTDLSTSQEKMFDSPSDCEELFADETKEDTSANASQDNESEAKEDVPAIETIREEENNSAKKSKDIIINFGKYRGKGKTASEVSTDKEFVEAAMKINASYCSSEVREQIDALKAACN